MTGARANTYTCTATDINTHLALIGFEKRTGYVWENKLGPDSDISVTRALLTYIRRAVRNRKEDLPRMILDHSLALECIGKAYLWKGVQRPYPSFAPDLHKHLIAPLLTLWLQELV